MPRLARDDAHFVVLPTIRCERGALTGSNGLIAALASVTPGKPRAELRAAVQGGAAALRPLLAEFAGGALARRLVGGASDRPPAVVIAVDQAEELFRTQGKQENEALLKQLGELASGVDPAVIVVFAIRSDSYDALEHAKGLEGMRQTTMPLLPMPQGSYAEVIEGPARRIEQAGGKLTIEPRLVERLLADIEEGGGRDALPLLAFTLEQLYLDYGASGALKLADYEAFGGLKGVIDDAARSAFARADVDARIPKDNDARFALLRRGLIPWLADIDPESKRPRRNIARRSDIAPETAPLLDLLVDERLLSADTRVEREATGAEAHVATIEPTHEALLRQWGMLGGWLKEDFGLLATLERVKRASRDWEANARDTAWLAHRGHRLADADALDARPDIAARLDALDRAYLAGCRAKEAAEAAEAEAQRKEREQEHARALNETRAAAAANRRLAKAIAAGLVAAIVLAVAAVWFGLDAKLESQIAQRLTAEARLDQSVALAAISKVVLPNSPAVAAKLALAAWPRTASDGAPKLRVAIDALGEAVPQLRERLALRGHERAVNSAVFSPDGRRVVTASDDDDARVWDATTAATLVVLKGHRQTVNGAAFSPDGARIVTASYDHTALVWDATTGETAAILKGHDLAVNSAAFSPDSARVVTASTDKTARVWDAATGATTAILKGHDLAVNSAAFSPDGARVVTASADHTARVWEAATGATIAILKGHDDAVNGAAFSPDGARRHCVDRQNGARLGRRDRRDDCGSEGA